MEDLEVYWFNGNGDCEACSAMTGLYTEHPDRPHENCECPIEQGEVRCELVSESREIFDQYELLEPIGWIPKGGSIDREKNWNTETSVSGSGEISGEVGGVGVSVGGEASESSSSGGSETVHFEYDEEEGGDSQLVLARYEVTIWRITQTWVAHWSEGFGMDHEFETYEHEEEQVFAGYEQEGF